jgi:hypothetical protein
MREGRARLCLLHRQVHRRRNRGKKASEEASFRMTERGLFRLLREQTSKDAGQNEA